MSENNTVGSQDPVESEGGWVSKEERTLEPEKEDPSSACLPTAKTAVLMQMRVPLSFAMSATFAPSRSNRQRRDKSETVAIGFNLTASEGGR